MAGKRTKRKGGRKAKSIPKEGNIDVCIVYTSVGAPVSFFTGTRLRLPLKNAWIPAPWIFTGSRSGSHLKRFTGSGSI